MIGHDPDRPRPTVARRMFWLALFAVNGIVPLWFGYHLTELGGRVGMVAGVAALLALWVLVVPRVPRVRAALVPGSVALALSQVYPLLQGVAGLLSLLLVGYTDFLNPHAGPADMHLSRLNDVTAFVATLSTGVILWVFAVVLGFVILSSWRVLTGGVDRRDGQSAAN